MDPVDEAEVETLTISGWGEEGSRLVRDDIGEEETLWAKSKPESIPTTDGHKANDELNYGIGPGAKLSKINTLVPQIHGFGYKFHYQRPLVHVYVRTLSPKDVDEKKRGLHFIDSVDHDCDYVVYLRRIMTHLDTSREDGEGPYNEKEEDDGKKEENGIKKKEEMEKDTLKTDPRAKAAHMVDQLSKVGQLRSFIKNLQPTYREHLRFTPFENFITLSNVSMLVEEKLAQEVPTKVTNNSKGNNQNRDKKNNGSKSEEVYFLNSYIKYILIRTTYTQALEHLLSKCKIDPLSIKAEII
ncbi:hypothetical protein Cgig2_031933 [Carnegiea gigantea]|uniref:Uncharacterized protein n=1 Tax=Carnegiea gigantea TaxID=171969 RepID=A0A9Q1GNH8_9CARY|nr:hypothetical protein Cgig2_031933 [Carnegiea gigantea]